MTKNGSALLLILFTMTALLLLGATAWRSAYLARHSVAMRHEQCKNHYALESLLLYGVAYVRLHGAFVHACTQPITLTFATWPGDIPEYHAYKSACITIQPKKNTFVVAAELIPHNSRHTLRGSCAGAIKEHNGQIDITTSHWQC